jgi:hypothetical protein
MSADALIAVARQAAGQLLDDDRLRGGIGRQLVGQAGRQQRLLGVVGHGPSPCLSRV